MDRGATVVVKIQTGYITKQFVHTDVADPSLFQGDGEYYCLCEEVDVAA